jgi:hypothetical protein
LNTHERFSCEKPRSSWMRGKATPMIEVSMMTMNWAAAISASAVQRRGDGADMMHSTWLMPYLGRVSK